LVAEQQIIFPHSPLPGCSADIRPVRRDR
jgi:hypothetical protein